MDVQHGHGWRAVAARVLDVARTGEAGHGAEAGQSLAGHVVRHEPAVGVAEEVHRPEVLGTFFAAATSSDQVGDIVLAGLAALAAPVGGVPEAVPLPVLLPIGQQQGEAVGCSHAREEARRRRGRRSFPRSREARR